MGQSQVVRELFRHTKLDVNASYEDSGTCLWVATCNGNLEAVCELLNYDKVDVNPRDYDGDKSLMDEGKLRRTEIVRELLKHVMGKQKCQS